MFPNYLPRIPQPDCSWRHSRIFFCIGLILCAFHNFEQLQDSNLNRVSTEPTFQQFFSLDFNTLSVTVCLMKCIKVEVDENSSFYGEIFHSPDAFMLDYAQMERELKVFMYPDGDLDPDYMKPWEPTKKYRTEGHFFKTMKESRFLTTDPNNAHLFFIPIACHKMESKGVSSVKEYVESLISKYPYWKRSRGADHFFVTCHDNGLKAIEGFLHLFVESIRVLSFSNAYNSAYDQQKDVLLPQFLKPGRLPDIGNDSLVERMIFTVPEYIEDLPQYYRDSRPPVSCKKCYRNKFCFCYEPFWIVDSINYGCIPVYWYLPYWLPLMDVLDWKKFSVIIKIERLDMLSSILERLSKPQRFTILHTNAVKAQQHFRWNTRPVKYDAFHMVPYELWLRRHNVVHCRLY